MAAWRLVGLACSAIAIVYCSASGEADDEGDVHEGEGGAGGQLFGGFGGGGGQTGCTEAAELIYVLSDTNELYSFKPDERLFTLIGPLGCNTMLQPNSMAIDRNAVAWVNYVLPDFTGDTAGVIYQVSTSDASCEPSPTVTLPSGYFRVGMGFSTDGANTDSETLYVAGISSGALARIDMSTNSLVPIGSFTGQFAGQNAELTGTGDGRLYGFFTSTPVEVADIDKSSGAILSSTPLSQVEVPTYWAFSFWGGDFYLYTANDLTTTRVNRFRPSDNSVDTAYMTDVGFRIVGAGVSTCAPLEPPQ